MGFLIDPAIDDYCQTMASGESEVLQALARATCERTRYPDNMSGRLVGQTLKLLAAITQSRSVLEIGMFTGYAALSMAEGMPEDGVLYCCEANPRAIEIAQEFFDQSCHGHKIRVLFGKARQSIARLDCQLDMVFIDADKKAYGDYFEQVFPMVRSGGLIIIDDALWKGQVLNPQDERGQVIAELNSRIARCRNVENVLLPVRHGLNIVRKL